ncbi:hypothetical protein MVEG_04500 [Podila verticillata NRRL 6337]|nr:hypothetical protein MVEG_04500 [Podila verticillata NRRL 6337]
MPILSQLPSSSDALRTLQTQLQSSAAVLLQMLRTILAKYPQTLNELKQPRQLLRVLFTLWILKTVKNLAQNEWFHPLSHIPRPFLISSTFFFAGLSTYSGRSHYFILILHRYYGKVVRFAPNIVSIADKDMIKEILVATDYPKSIIHEGFELNEQHNLFTSRNKDFHKNRRRLVAPAFGLQYLRTLEPTMQQCIEIMIRKIDELLADPTAVKRGTKVLPHGQINICSMMMRLALDIIGETAYGESFDMILNEDHPVPHVLARTLKRCMQQTFNPWMKHILPIDWSLVDFGEERVQKRKQAGEQGRRADLLQYLIDAQANERRNGNGETGDEYEDMISGKLTDKAVMTEATIFLVAGSETSSTALTFTLMYLVKNTDKLAKLREELDLATASNAPGVLPSYDQVRNLPYLTGCINEALRLRPIAATGLPRDITEDITMKGYFFPKGTIALAQLPQLHWSDEYFPQASAFIPERWIPGLSPFPPVQDFTFYPFSAGTRNCVGKNFAMMEMRLILASLVLTYDMERVRFQRVDYVQFITTALATESYVVKMKRRGCTRNLNRI